MLPVALRHQYPDGRAVRQFAKFEGVPHDTRMYMDSSSWIPDPLVDYLKETGDFDILEKEEGFLNPETGRVEDDLKATIYEHAFRGVTALYEHRGLYGLCRIGHGDWNDALSRIGGEKGVSVWLSCACVYQCKLMAELAEFLGRGDDAAAFRRVAAEMTERINAHGWDGKWYIRGFTKKGIKIGSNESEEGKLFLNAQTWAVYSGVASPERGKQCMDEVDKHLYSKYGLHLLWPSYSKPDDDIGYVTRVYKGIKENGSIFCEPCTARITRR